MGRVALDGMDGCVCVSHSLPAPVAATIYAIIPLKTGIVYATQIYGCKQDKIGCADGGGGGRDGQ